jgi:hypothetical protein
MRTRHEGPLQTPVKPENEKPAPGVAVRRTDAPSAKLAEQACGQLMPAGSLVTVPLPATPTVSW